MITLIGTRCKHSNMLSRGVLIRRFLLGNIECHDHFYLLLAYDFKLLHYMCSKSLI